MAVSGLESPPDQNMFQSLSILAFISGSSTHEHLCFQLAAQTDDLLQIFLLEQWHRCLGSEAGERWLEQIAVLDVMLALEDRFHCPQEIYLVGVEVVLLDHEGLESLLYLFFWSRELIKT